MRRAMRHGRMLGLTQPFLWDMTGGVVALMGDAYPEIREAQARVAETVKQEEERFAETLDLGMARIREEIDRHRSGVTLVDGRFLFTLYDTYGFPPDLAKEVFEDAGWQITAETDRVFEAEMEAQRERARAERGHLPAALHRAGQAPVPGLRLARRARAHPRPGGGWPAPP
jgi:alanyl-tRNA synthetase